MNKRNVGAVVLVLGMLLAMGCKPTPPPPDVSARKQYIGPLHPLGQIVSVLAQRSQGVRTLWARHDFAVSFRDANGRLHSLDGDGVLLVRKPVMVGASGVTELRLTGSKDIAGQVFDLGVNTQVAWLTLQGDIDTQWWLATNPVPADLDATQIPIRPDLVPELLGIQDWATDLGRYPTPIVTYDGLTDEYVLTLVEPAALPRSVGGGGGQGGLVARRQLRLARTNLLINSISFFSPDGRVVATSTLSNWQPVPNVATATLVPTDITLVIPGSNTNLRFTLREIALRKGKLPADVSFTYPPKPPVSRVVNLASPAGAGR